MREGGGLGDDARSARSVPPRGASASRWSVRPRPRPPAPRPARTRRSPTGRRGRRPEGAGDRRAGDRAEAPDPARRAEGGPRIGGRVDAAPPTRRRAPARRTRRSRRAGRRRTPPPPGSLHREQREEHGRRATNQVIVAGRTPMRSATRPPMSSPITAPTFSASSRASAARERVAGAAHDLGQPGVQAVDEEQAHERRDPERDRRPRVARAEQLAIGFLTRLVVPAARHRGLSRGSRASISGTSASAGTAPSANMNGQPSFATSQTPSSEAATAPTW